MDDRYEPAPAADVASYFMSHRDDPAFVRCLKKRRQRERIYANLSDNKKAIVQLYFLTDWWRFEQAREEIESLGKGEVISLPRDISAEVQRRKDEPLELAEFEAMEEKDILGVLYEDREIDELRAIVEQRPDVQVRAVEEEAGQELPVTGSTAVAPFGPTPTLGQEFLACKLACEMPDRVHDRGWGGQVYLAFAGNTNEMRLFWTLRKELVTDQLSEMLVQVTNGVPEYHYLGIMMCHLTQPGNFTFLWVNEDSNATPLVPRYRVPPGAKYQRFVAQTAIPMRVDGSEAMVTRAQGKGRNQQSVGSSGSAQNIPAWPRTKSLAPFIRREIWKRARMLLSIQPLGYYTPLSATQETALANLKVRGKRNRKNKGQLARPANTGNAPRRPVPAFAHFKADYQKNHPTLTTTELAADAATVWTAMSADSKKRYEEAAAADLERFTLETSAYNRALAAELAPTVSPVTRARKTVMGADKDGDGEEEDAPGPWSRSARNVVASEDDAEDAVADEAMDVDNPDDESYHASGADDDGSDDEEEEDEEEVE